MFVCAGEIGLLELVVCGSVCRNHSRSVSDRYNWTSKAAPHLRLTRGLFYLYVYLHCIRHSIELNKTYTFNPIYSNEDLRTSGI